MIRHTARIFLALFAIAACLYGQTGNGSIQGTVKDASGAVVPAAKVTLVNAGTNAQFETATNGVGFFVFPSVQRGNYKVSVQAPGMESWAAEMLLQVGQTAVLDPVLKVGATATEVVVAGDVTPLVQTANATLANTLERARIEQLPLNGRFFQSLVMKTVPGMEGAMAAPRVNGMRASSMEFVQDGAVLTNRDTGELAGRPPGIDSIEEFRVETSNSSAKLNRPATTIIMTRSGTNDLHGAAFETVRNNAFGLARARQDFYTKAPHLVRNEFGASLGGPVFLPKVYNGKNKTFFFFSYEAYRNLSASTTSTNMPTMAMRQGDFSGLVDSSGRKYTVYDPWTTDSKTYARQPFPNNIIPQNRMSPLAKYLYSVTPAPTLTEVNPLTSNNWFGLGPSNRRDWTITSRVDHRLSDRDQVFGRFSLGNRWSTYRSGNGSPVTLDGSANVTVNPITSKSAVASWTHTFSPTFFSETLFNVSNENYFIYSGQDLNYADQLGLPNPFNALGFPPLTSTGFGMDYEYPDNRRQNITRIYNWDQNFTKIYGRHELEFGGRFRNETLNVLPDQQQVQGSHSFGSSGTALMDPSTIGGSYSSTPYTGHAAASLFIGSLNYYSAQFARKWYNLNAREYSLYFQDNFKVNSRLTLNLGVRWEFYPNISENNNILTGFDTKTHSVINGATLDTMYKVGATTPAIVNLFQKIDMKFVSPKDAGLPDKLIYSNPHDFGPRAGFAYRLGDGTRAFVLRGGYSLYGFPIPLRTFDARSRSNPPTNARFETSIDSSSWAPDGLPNLNMRSAPVFIAGVNSKDAINTNNPSSVSRGSFRTSYFSPNQPTSRSHQWNLALEREVAANTVARVQYVGNHGARLDQFYTYNDQAPDYVWYATTGLPTPKGTFSGTARRAFDQVTYGTLEEYRKTGWSNYNGVQMELRRQYSKGYAYQAFYVIGNAFIAGGNGWSSDFVNVPANYMPGAVPTSYDGLNRFLNYRRDSGIPKHRVQFNWLVDLPFGRGKKLLGNAGGVLDRIVGGWQVAGFGSIASTFFSLPTTNWGPTSKIEVYGKKYPVQDCRSGQCIQGYLWWNGYIPANRINSTDPKTGKPNGIMGVPSDYKPAVTPLIPIPANGGSPSDPLYSFYDSNTVWVPMKDGSTQRISFDNALNPWRNQLIPGPRAWNVDASLFKAVKINEQMSARFTADFFNVFNTPGLSAPGGNGFLSLQYSNNSPRQMQLSLRLQW